jgi:hypothetical protein
MARLLSGPNRLLGIVAAAGLLVGCSQTMISTQTDRIGPDDGTDSCRPQLVALDETGHFFTTDIFAGAATNALSGAWNGLLSGGGVQAIVSNTLGATTDYWNTLQQQSMDRMVLSLRVSGDLTRENDGIDRTQQAFNNLMDCRFRQAQAIRANLAARRISRPEAVAEMAVVRERVQRDLGLAQDINSRIDGRAHQFDVAVDHVSPGAPPAPSPRPTVSQASAVRRPAPLLLRPDPAAPPVTQLDARQQVTVTGPAQGGYAPVTTANGTRGYAPVASLDNPGKVPQAPPPAASKPAGEGDVRTLAGSNAERRDNFADSVAVSQQAAATGFEIAS